MTRKSVPISVVVAVIFVTTLAGCSSSNPSSTPPSPSSTQSSIPSSTPSVTASATAQDVDRVGQVISAEQAAALPAGQKAYPMADGSLVVVEKGKPLPAAVIADVTAPAQVAQNAVPGTSVIQYKPGMVMPGDAIAMVVNGQIRNVYTKTGNSAIVVYRIYGARAATPDTYEWIWTATTPLGSTFDKAGKVAEANAFVASQPNPVDWTVIVLN